MGPAGRQGEPGPASASGGLRVVDAAGTPVGQLIDAYNGWVVRSVGPDRVVVPTSAAGVPEGTATFYHTTTNCTGERYLFNYNGAGIVFFAQFANGHLLYTRAHDSGLGSRLMGSVETLGVNQAITEQGETCAPYEYTVSVGVAVTAPAPELRTLVAPLRVE